MNWPRLIAELQARGVTLEQIAEAVGITVRMVSYLKATGADPRHSVGQRLFELHRLKCSTENMEKAFIEKPCME